MEIAITEGAAVPRAVIVRTRTGGICAVTVGMEVIGAMASVWVVSRR